MNSISSTDEELIYWLALWRINGVGSVFFKRVLDLMGSPVPVFEHDYNMLKNMGFSDLACTQIGQFNRGVGPIVQGVEKDLSWLSGDHCHILRWKDILYPPMLKEIQDAPPVLFVKGDPHFLHDVQVAIVGSRHPSRAGIENAAAFSSHLVELGLIPTSGLALGIDGAAHQAAITKHKPTIAVLGNGLDVIYPKKHQSLTEEIIQYGAIVSEFGVGVAPKASHFPRRNRIISGLSVGVLVVEAALRSGSLITARLALEQGREVFAIPGSIHNPMAKGCHKLIREGAKLVENAEHILEEVQALMQLQLDVRHGFPTLKRETSKKESHQTSKIEPKTAPLPSDMSDQEQVVISCLGYEPTPLDLLVERTSIESKQLASVMVMLEIKGHITVEPGGYMRRSL